MVNSPSDVDCEFTIQDIVVNSSKLLEFYPQLESELKSYNIYNCESPLMHSCLHQTENDIHHKLFQY